MDLRPIIGLRYGTTSNLYYDSGSFCTHFSVSGVNNGLICVILLEIHANMTTVRPFTCDDMFTFNNV